jgi:ATP-dependent Clp protease ATP-binding subunit ClpC
VQVLDAIVQPYATSAKLVIEAGAVNLAHRLFKRFQPYTAFPGPAAGFLRQLCTARPTALDRAEVVRAFVRRTGLPELFLRDELPLVAEELRKEFAARIVGQAEATSAAARLVATIKAGLTDPARPPGVLLFCGPTGVGKTALARLLADFCFGGGGEAGPDRFIRLDMSEYSGWFAAQRFLQNPQGQPAAWIESVRRQPFCLVLFDEIEKAAPEVFDVLLSLMDEGRLTDRFGRVTWFRSAIVILTSNLGANATGVAGFTPAETVMTNTSADFASAVSKFFRPEFFNRLDAVVTFKSLDRAEVERIAIKELNDLAAREGLAAAALQLRWSPALVAAVAEAGYDHRLGARPLQRALERMVVTPLARWKVAHPKERNRILELDYRGNTVVVREI